MAQRSGGCQQKLQGCPQLSSGRQLADAGRDLDAGQGSTTKQPTIQSSTSPSAPTSLSSFSTSAPAHSHAGRPFTCITAQHAVVPSSPPSTSNVPHTAARVTLAALLLCPEPANNRQRYSVSSHGMPLNGTSDEMGSVMGPRPPSVPPSLPRCDIDVRLHTMGTSTPASPGRSPSHWLHGRIKRCVWVIRDLHAGRYAHGTAYTCTVPCIDGMLMHASQRGTSSGMDYDCCALQGRRERSKGNDPTRLRQSCPTRL